MGIPFDEESKDNLTSSFEHIDRYVLWD